MKHESITVRILGRDYPLLVQSSDVATIYGVAENVNQRMRAFKEKHPEQPDLVAAVFAAMELSEELLGIKETSNVLLNAIDREAENLDRELMKALKNSAPSES